MSEEEPDGDEACAAEDANTCREDPLAEDDEDGEDCEDDEECDSRVMDLGLAAALDSTILSCLNLVIDNPQLRNLLDRARRQIAELRGLEAPPEPKTDVDAKLSELRALMGMPETSSVKDCFEFLKCEGSAAS